MPNPYITAWHYARHEQKNTCLLYSPYSLGEGLIPVVHKIARKAGKAVVKVCQGL